MTGTGPPLVSCRDAGRTYGSGAAAVVAVHGTNCQVHPQDRIALMGPSGSGKSTLLHLMAGLEQPTSGEVVWPWCAADTAVPGAGAPARAKGIGVIFQSSSLIPTLDVAENTGLPLVLAGESAERADARALAALESVGVADLAAKLPDDISGGQAQRVAAARVLAARPRLVLADEPTGRLDRTTGRRLVDVLLAAVDEIGAALVVATHDPAVGERLRTRWTMRDGRLLRPDAGAP
ncbi:ATP-binding cassette domain-containing protein [Streptomyces sp. NPDC006670]|uniref:ABC transporter ATP-binding protein n=1 Tax=Streptomyces sp. NPDC006670 TaxID=3154476 RepID=UPI0034106770